MKSTQRIIFAIGFILVIAVGMAVSQTTTCEMNGNNINTVYSVNYPVIRTEPRLSDGLTFESCASETIESALVTLYDEYAKECYNDSTVTRGHTDSNSDTNGCVYLKCLGSFECANSSHYIKVTHHQEVSFEGFINYLRKAKK